MKFLKTTNELVRFVLEVASVIAIGYSGFQLKSLGSLRFIVGIGAPLAVIFVWGRWGAPLSPHHLVGLARLSLECGIFALAVVSLLVGNRPTWAGILAVAVLVNAVLLYVLK